MTKDELVAKLNAIAAANDDPEEDHHWADELLLDFIDDDEVRQAFLRITRWYA